MTLRATLTNSRPFCSLNRPLNNKRARLTRDPQLDDVRLDDDVLQAEAAHREGDDAECDHCLRHPLNEHAHVVEDALEEGACVERHAVTRRVTLKNEGREVTFEFQVEVPERISRQIQQLCAIQQA